MTAKILRQQLGFKGLIITDDMEMGALTKGYSFSEMGYKALAAGAADLILICHNLEHQKEVYRGIYEALWRGLVDNAQVAFKFLRQFPQVVPIPALIL